MAVISYKINSSNKPSWRGKGKGKGKAVPIPN